MSTMRYTVSTHKKALALQVLWRRRFLVHTSIQKMGDLYQITPDMPIAPFNPTEMSAPLAILLMALSSGLGRFAGRATFVVGSSSQSFSRPALPVPVPAPVARNRVPTLFDDAPSFFQSVFPLSVIS